jgi:hypothetical protein
MTYRKATIIIDIPQVKKEQSSINMIFDVKGMLEVLEGQIATFMSTDKKLRKPEGEKTRFEEAIFMLHELRKFYLADAAEVKTLPEEIK